MNEYIEFSRIPRHIKFSFEAYKDVTLHLLRLGNL